MIEQAECVAVARARRPYENRDILTQCAGARACGPRCPRDTPSELATDLKYQAYVRLLRQNKRADVPRV